MSKPTYEITDDGRAIKCLKCNRTSWHPDDVKKRYCGCCHEFHDRPEIDAALKKFVRSKEGDFKALLDDGAEAFLERVEAFNQEGATDES
jgi:hypothetical protein